MTSATQAPRLRPHGTLRAALHLLALPLLTLLPAREAAAAWPADPNVNVPLCLAAGTSQVTSVVSDMRGGAIAVWYDDRSANFDVFARRVDSGGVARWGTDGVQVAVVAGTSAQILPKAVSDGAGGAIVVWIDNRTTSNMLYAQRVDSSGTRLWGNGGVQVATAPNNNGVTTFDIAADGAGGVAVAWAAQIGLSTDIFAQCLGSNGAAKWTTAGRTLCNNLLDQTRPTVVRKASGTFVVAWEDTRSGFRSDIYGQALNGTGTALWAANGLLLAGSAQNAINPLLLATGTDDCIMVWDADSLGVGDVRSQRLGTTGAAQWPTAGLRVFPAGVSGLSGITSDGSGGAFALVSSPNPSTGKLTLWINRIAFNGNMMVGTTGARVSSHGSNQISAVLAADGGTGCVVAWFDDVASDGSTFQLYAQRVAPNGSTRWAASGIPVCLRADQVPSVGMVTASANRDVVLAWSDTRASAAADVYAQGVDSTGALGAQNVAVGPGPAPAATALARPSPNPAPRGVTTLSYTLSAREHVRLQVIDPAGRVVSVLEDGMREAGQHQVAWDGRSDGRTLPPGLYLVHLRTSTRNEIRRLVLL